MILTHVQHLAKARPPGATRRTPRVPRPRCAVPLPVADTILQ